MNLPESFSHLIESFQRLPGVGEKTATRFALLVSNWSAQEVLSFAKSVSAMNDLKKCEICGFFTEVNKCQICSDERRKDSAVLCIVENINDCLAIEKSGQFSGHYHILGGVLNPLMGIGPERLNLGSLANRISENDYEEVILAINPSVEGDATSSFIRDILPESAVVKRIGFGVPMGGNLEYLDPLTISQALENTKLL